MHSVGPNPRNDGSANHMSSPAGTEETRVPTKGVGWSLILKQRPELLKPMAGSPGHR